MYLTLFPPPLKFKKEPVMGNLKVESFPMYIKIVPLLEQIINEGKWI